jgi:capsular exopolysaccharide synthesis family protein
LDNPTGLTTTLVGGGSGFSFVTSTQHEGVHVLTAGPMPPNPAELLESRRMKQILHEVTQAYDLVLIDSPPVIAVTDASVLAQSVDGVIIVLAAGEVERENALQAKEQLNQVGAKILGTVVNKVKVKKDTYYYGEEMLQKTPGIKEHLQKLGAKVLGISINKIKAKKHHRNKN